MLYCTVLYLLLQVPVHLYLYHRIRLLAPGWTHVHVQIEVLALVISQVVTPLAPVRRTTERENRTEQNESENENV